MTIEVYHFYTREENKSPYIIYGNVPFVFENAICTIFLNGKEIKIKVWTYEMFNNKLVLYEYMCAGVYQRAIENE